LESWKNSNCSIAKLAEEHGLVKEVSVLEVGVATVAEDVREVSVAGSVMEESVHFAVAVTEVGVITEVGAVVPEVLFLQWVGY